MALLYTIEEAAGILGMNPGELKGKAQAREIPAILCSGTWRLRVDDVNELARRRGARTPLATASAIATLAPPAELTAASASRAEAAAPPPSGSHFPVELAPASSQPTTATVPSPPPPPPPVETTAPKARPVAPPAPAVVPGVFPEREARPAAAVAAGPAASEPVPRFPDGFPAVPDLDLPSVVSPPSAADSLVGQAVATPVKAAGAAAADAAAPVSAAVLPMPESASKSSLSHLDDLTFSIDLELPPEWESAGQVAERPAKQEAISVDDLGFTLSEELSDAHEATQVEALPSMDRLAEQAADALASGPSTEGDWEILARTGERTQVDAGIAVQCPNPACQAPGTVAPDELDRQMTCKVCGTDFYYDRGSGQYVIGLRPEGKRSRVPRDAVVITASPSAPPGTRPWRQKRKTKRLWFGIGAVVLVAAILSQLELPFLSSIPKLPNQVQVRAQFVADALAKDDRSSVRAISESSTRGDVGRWFAAVRPDAWPADNDGVSTSVALEYVHLKAGDALTHVEVRRAPKNRGAEAKGAGPVRISVPLYWTFTSDRQWLFNVSRSLKAAKGESAAAKAR